MFAPAVKNKLDISDLKLARVQFHPHLDKYTDHKKSLKEQELYNLSYIINIVDSKHVRVDIVDVKLASHTPHPWKVFNSSAKSQDSQADPKHPWKQTKTE